MACIILNTPLTLVSITSPQSLGEILESLSTGPSIPALLIKISSEPKVSNAAFTALFTWFESETSQTKAFAFDPILSAIFCKTSALRAIKTTFASSAAKCWAVAAPIPRLAPVIKTVLPVNVISFSFPTTIILGLALLIPSYKILILPLP